MRIQSSSQRKQTRPGTANKQHQATTRQRALALAVSSALLGATGTCLPVVANAQLFPAVLELSSLDGTNGLSFEGEGAGYSTGRSVSFAGDINADGLTDLVIGANSASVNGNSSGKVYVVFGSATSGTSNIPLSSLNGTNGFALHGESTGDSAGFSVSDAGDINGDGIDDLIIGAERADFAGNQAGRSYIVFGRDTAVSGNYPASFELADMDGLNGFKINGESESDYSGRVVSTAGDINADGLSDVIVCARSATPNGSYSGRCYVIFGKDTAATGNFTEVIQLASLSGTAGFKIDGETAGDLAGTFASNAGDINGDGIDDLMISAYGADVNGPESGRIYIIFGRDFITQGPFSSPFALSDLDGTNGLVLNGEAEYDRAGSWLSYAGDLNADGHDDIIISARGADPNGSYSGRSYVLFGRDTATQGSFQSPLELSSFNGNDGFKIDGEVALDFLGGGVHRAGDINSDGIDDVIIGASGADPNGTVSGRSYVVFGRDPDSQGAFPATLPLSSLDSFNGFKLDGTAEFDRAGNAVGGGEDFNGDGIDDLIIGAYGARINGNNVTGKVFLVFGRRPPTSELSVRMRDCRDPARPGGTIEYGIQISNQGPDDAADVLLESTLAPGLSLLSASPGGLCTETGGNLSCNIGSVAADTAFSLGLVVSVGAGLSGPVSSSVTIATENADNPINNFATETTIVLGDLLFLDGGEKCGP